MKPQPPAIMLISSPPELCAGLTFPGVLAQVTVRDGSLDPEKASYLMPQDLTDEKRPNVAEKARSARIAQ
jgi:hypothetical protein